MTFSKTSFTSSRRGRNFRRDGIRKIFILASFFIIAICVLPIASHPLKDDTSNSEQSDAQLPPTDENIALESSSKNGEAEEEAVRQKRQIFDFNLDDQIDLSQLASVYNLGAQFIDGGQSFGIPVSIDIGNLERQLESLTDVSDVSQNVQFTMGSNFNLGDLSQAISIGHVLGETMNAGTFKIETGGASPISIDVREISDGEFGNGEQIVIGNYPLNVPVVEIGSNQVIFDGSEIKIISGQDPQQFIHVCQSPDCPSNAGIAINIDSDVGLEDMLAGRIDVCQMLSLATNSNGPSLDLSTVRIDISDTSGLTYTVPFAISISNPESGTISLSGQDCRLLAQRYGFEETLNGYNINLGGDVTCNIVLSSLNIGGCQGSPATPAPTTPQPTTTTLAAKTTTTTTTPKPTTTTTTTTTPKPTTTTTTTTTPKPTTTTTTTTTPKPTTTTTTTTTPKPTTTTTTTTTPKPTTTTTTTTTPKPTTTTTTTTTPQPTTTTTTTTTPAPTTTTLPETTTQLPRTLRYRDYSAEPCEDFYQYACGGFEADPDLEETDFEEEANKRILAESKTRINSTEAAQFTAYYESCLNYDERVSKPGRIRLAIQAVDEIGKLFVDETWTTKDYDLTDLLIKLIEHDSPILFDLSVDVDHRDSGKYIVTLEPPPLKSPLFVYNEETECRVFENDRNHTGRINLGELHANYTTCKKHKSAAVHTIASATQELLSSSNGSGVDELKQLAQAFQNDAENFLFDGFLWTYPSEDEAHYDRTTKNFEVVSVQDLEEEIRDVGIDWHRLLSTVTKTEVTKDTKLQAYSFPKLVEGFEVFKYVSPMTMNNALVSLYIRNIYHELIVPRPADVENYCMNVAKHLMKVQTSSLYLSSYSKEDLRKINKEVSTVFETLKETLRLDVENVNEQAAWFGPEVHDRLLKRIEELNLVQPDPSAYENNQADLDTSLSENFFENTMKLRKNYRTSLYDRLTKDPNDSKEIWNHFALPYQTEALPLYGTNQIVIPYGWVGQSNLLEPDVSPMNYSAAATLGHIISRQIAHQFDDSSIKFKASFVPEEDLFANDLLAKNSRLNNTECYKQNNKVPRSILLPLSNRKIRFEITEKSADERFADAVALNLTYNTMFRMSAEFGAGNDEDVKQFFLDYAQMHCTKIPLTSSGTSTLAFQYLPSRIRLMVVAEQSHPFRRAFGCPRRLEPICDVFPYIKPVKPFVRIPEAKQGQ